MAAPQTQNRSQNRVSGVSAAQVRTAMNNHFDFRWVRYKARYAVMVFLCLIFTGSFMPYVQACSIAGNVPVCAGSILPLSGSPGGGAWNSTNTAIATVNGSGVVTGVSNGTCIISYTISGCTSTVMVTVNTMPVPIGGSNTVCTGSTITLSDATAGGIWGITSSHATATPTGANYAVTGNTAGTATITYTKGTGINACSVYSTITINAMPNPINGVPLPPVCVGNTLSITDGTGGGTWSSSSTGIATISSGGVLTGVSNGTTTVFYTVSGCSATTTATVNLTPTAIGGSLSICNGATTTLTNSVGGGTWNCTSSHVSTSTVSGNLITTGLTVGTADVTYTIGSGINACPVYTTVSVNTMPASIGGTPLPPICMGNTLNLTDGTGGGTWSSVSTSIATVSGAVLTGVTAGTSVISYTIGSCAVTTVATVNTAPGAIAGPTTVCTNSSVTLTNSVSGGVWNCTSSNVSTATSSGSFLITGVTAGTATITYTVGTGINACPVYTTITVNPTGTITPSPVALCIGATRALVNNPAPGGTWSSVATGTATIGASTGMLTGVSNGADSIVYTSPAGCLSVIIITVNPLPAAITGTSSICSGFTTTFTDATSGGNWGSINTAIATIDASTGLAASIAGGVDTIIYNLPATGCVTLAALTVNPTPVISGMSTICTGSATTLTASVGSGTWTASNGMLTIGASSGAITGISAGIDTITYTLSTGCLSTIIITVNPTPGISGATMVCVGATTTLSGSISGGPWRSVTSNATIDPGDGIATGVSADTVTIVYSLATGCFATTILSVNPDPSITGASVVCIGSTITLTPSISGGVWSSNDTTIATVTVSGSDGIVLGISPGTSTISYLLTSTGCGVTATINDTSPGPITGTKSVCSGATTTLSNETSGGSWTSSDTTIATVGVSSGIVTGIATGASTPQTVTITYTTGCTPDVTAVVTVNPLPVISGAETVCVGSVITLSGNISGGTWSVSNDNATIDASAGILNGIAAGSDTVVYTLTTGCSVSGIVTINPLPVISGIASVCEAGAVTTLSGSIGGGSWSAINGNATVDASTGIVTGVSAGLDTIAYTLGTGCMSNIVVTINPLPASISGSSTVCAGSTATFTDATSGGNWAVTNGTAAIDASSGVATGIIAGVDTIIYKLPTGCLFVTPVTVNPLPASVSGSSAVCVGAITTFTDATSGGAWTAINGTATIDASYGIATGVSGGVDTVVYTLGTGCTSSAIITVNPLPVISGATTVCEGSAITLSGLITGGTWSATNGNAAIDAYSGVITGIAAGTDTITYTLPTGCLSTAMITVNPLPEISGTATFCTGSTTTLTASISGGIWSALNGNATVDASSGVITGITAGTDTIVYTLSTGCASGVVVYMNPLPVISGFTGVCIGSSTTLFDYTTGGTWSAVNGNATVGASTGIVTSVNVGVDTIEYILTATGCISSMELTVNPLPDSISGSPTVCEGSAITLTDAATGGIWSNNDGAVEAIDPLSGIVTGIAGGVDTVAYTFPTGCMMTTVITVNPVPDISGAASIYVGVPTTLASSFTGGVWTSVSGAAIVDSVSGILTGVTTDTVTIVYTIGTGCFSAALIDITMSPVPFGLHGPFGPLGLSLLATPKIERYAGDGTNGFSGDGSFAVSAWMHLPSGVALDPVTQDLYIADANNNRIRKVNRLTSKITTIAGLSTSGYNGDNGSASLAKLNIPTGVAVDRNENIYIADAANYRIRKINHATGIITTIGGNGFQATASTSGSAIASSLNNPSSVAVDSAGNVYFTDYPNGIYRIAASGGAISRIEDNTYGNITGLSIDISNNLYFTSNNNGIYKVTHSLTGGPVTGTAVHIAGITGTSGYGYIDTTALSSKFRYPAGVSTDNYGNVYISDLDNERIRMYNNLSDTFLGAVTGRIKAIAGNGTASAGYSYAGECVAATSSEVYIASGTGNNPYVTGIAVDNQGNIFFCDRLNQVVRMIDIATHAIVGPAAICGTAPVTLTGVPPGGSWSSGSTTIALISTSGVVTPGSSATVGSTATISYAGLCDTSTATIIIHATGTVTISGDSAVCTGSTLTLTGSDTGGVWSSNAAFVATVNPTTGIVRGRSAGVATITYTLDSCYAVETITVNATSSATISGSGAVCPAGTLALTATVPDGTWSSSDTGRATVNPSTGVIHGVAAGTDTITYSYHWCSGSTLTSSSVTKIITVTATPASISGVNNICQNTYTYLAAGVGGAWSSSNTGIATVNITSGEVHGIRGGGSTGRSLDTITYTYTCGSDTSVATFPMTINGPAVLTGGDTICLSSTITLTDSTHGGRWTRSNTHATIDSISTSSAIITGALAGTPYITYTTTTSGLSCYVTQPVYIVPGAPSLVPSIVNVCSGTETSLTASPAGGIPAGVLDSMWRHSMTVDSFTSYTDSSAANILIRATGGTDTVTYEAIYTCGIHTYTLKTTSRLTVVPYVHTITGPNIVCDIVPDTLSISDTGGIYGISYHIWSTSDSTVAIISPLGIITGISPVTATATITYTEYACDTSATTTYPITVIGVPDTIIGGGAFCTLATAYLSDSTPRAGIYRWTSSNIAVASIGATNGILHANTPGTAIITYGYGGCYATTILTVNPIPYITPYYYSTICDSTTLHLMVSPSGGTWTISDTSHAMVSDSGVVTLYAIDSSVHIVTITNTSTAGCTGTNSISFAGRPSAISGIKYLCRGGHTTLSDASTGGTWTSGNTSRATIDPSSGIVTGTPSSATTSATVVITYSTGCGSSVFATLTVNPSPVITSTVHEVCASSSISLTSNLSGGTWSSSDTSVATIDSATGTVISLTAGLDTITYRMHTGCYITEAVAVDSTPVVTNTDSTVCAGSVISLTPIPTGGAWSSRDSSIATIDSTGNLTGVAAGTDTVTYTLATGCFVTRKITVNPQPSVITGLDSVCAGYSISLSDSLAGGIWSIHDDMVAYVDTTGVVWGINPGNDTITYTMPGGCYVTKAVVINALPSIFGTTYTLCYHGYERDTLTLTIDPAGGSWTPDSFVAVTDTGYTAIVTDKRIGTAYLHYTTAAGCPGSATIAVDTIPVVTTAPDVVYCTPTTLTAYSATPDSFAWSPSGYIASGITTSSPVVSSSIPGGTTIFTATVYDRHGCHSSAMQALVKPSGPCNPCTSTPAIHLALGATGKIGADGDTTIIDSGNYYINRNDTIHGYVVMNDAVIMVNAGDTIFVDPNAALRLNGCHLYSCGSWGGIFLLSNDTVTGTLVTGADSEGTSTLIEDAYHAAHARSIKKPSRHSPYFIQSNNTIFNRNYTGIYIENYTPHYSSSHTNTYEFDIRNTVFTSRDFSSHTGFPVSWTNATGTGGLKTRWTTPPNAYTAPFNIADSAVGYPHSHTALGNYVSFGIVLVNVGASDSGYSGVKIGTAATDTLNNERNLFESIYQGIWTNNANIRVQNCAFANLGSTLSADTSGCGIYSLVTNGVRYQLSVVQGVSGSITSPNRFYNCYMGVFSRAYYHIICDSNIFITNHGVGSSTFPTGGFGYNAQSAAYDSVAFNSNTITNVANGISFVSTLAPGYYVSYGGLGYYTMATQYAGPITANHNTITATLNTDPVTGQYSNFGISLQNTVNNYGLLPGIIHGAGTVHTDTNTIHNTLHGILVQSYWMQNVYTLSDTISIFGSTTAGNRFCYGINHTDCSKNIISGNSITGASMTGMSSSHSPMTDSTKAIYVSTCNKPIVNCNTEDSTGRGFEFFHLSPGTQWMGNSMNNNLKGYTVNYSIIGQQGESCVPTFNTWIGSAWSSTTNRHTFVITDTAGTTNALHSKLYADSTPAMYPLYNKSTPPNNDYSFLSIGASPHALNPTVGTCIASPPCTNPIVIGPHGGGLGADAFVDIAANRISYASGDVRGWMGQNLVWQSSMADSDLIDSFSVIDSFYSLAGNSRYAYLTDLESALAVGDGITADSLLANPAKSLAPHGNYYDSTTGANILDDSTADYIVNNYLIFYGIYKNFTTGTLTNTDSMNLQTIAGQCPLQYGAVVYKARSLYTAVFNQLIAWNDDYCGALLDSVIINGNGERKGDIGKSAANNATITQRYMLSPNPNDGSFSLSQLYPDTKPVKAEIWNSLGQNVYNATLNFISGSDNINLSNFVQGLYMIRLTDSQDRTFKIKFIIE